MKEQPMCKVMVILFPTVKPKTGFRKFRSVINWLDLGFIDAPICGMTIKHVLYDYYELMKFV